MSPEAARQIFDATIQQDVRDILVRQHNELVDVCNRLGIHSACVVDNSPSDLADTSYALWSASALSVNGIHFLEDTEFPALITHRIQDIGSDLILMDHDLGNGYGSAVIRSIRKNAPLPICIGYSALSNNEQSFLTAGADGFVTKQSRIQMQRFVHWLTKCLETISTNRTS